MGKTRAECSQNAYTSHASAFLSHWIQILSKFFAQIWHKKKKKKPTLFFRNFNGRSGEGNIIFFFGLIMIRKECRVFRSYRGQRYHLSNAETLFAKSYWAASSGCFCIWLKAAEYWRTISEIGREGREGKVGIGREWTVFYLATKKVKLLISKQPGDQRL